jgi:hypothetical protein
MQVLGILFQEFATVRITDFHERKVRHHKLKVVLQPLLHFFSGLLVVCCVLPNSTFQFLESDSMLFDAHCSQLVHANVRRNPLF